MSSINVNVEDTKKKFFVERIKNELEDLNLDNPRYVFLSTILENIPQNDNTLEKTLKEVYDNTYKKTWAKLPLFHKIHKIDEYIETLKMSSAEKKKIREQIIAKIGDHSKLSGGTIIPPEAISPKGNIASLSVTYNTVTCKITKLVLNKNAI